MTKKLLGLKDITLLTFFSNFGVRWLAVAAGMGAVSVFYWIIGAISLAIPMAFMCAQLSRKYPEEGGLYAWTRHTLGEKNGFVVAWLYFINNLFYYPAILIFLATNFAFVIGNPALANNSMFICISVLVAFWFVILISIFGLKMNKIATEFGGLFGSLVPAILIIVLAIAVYLATKQSATAFNWQSMISQKGITNSLSNLTMIMFAMTGVEIIPTFANAVKNPKRDLYFGLIIGAIALVILYIIGTISLNIILAPDDIQKTSGLMHAFQLVFQRFHMPQLTPLVAMLLVFAELGIVSMWLIAPITMFFKCSPKGVLPEWFQKTNKNEAPINALLFVGVIVSFILMTTTFLPAVNDMYQILVLMSVLLTFIPYLFLVRVYIKNMKSLNGNGFWKWFFVCTVFVSLCLGIIFSFQLPSNLTTLNSKILYESEMFFGPAIFMGIGYWIFLKRHPERKRR
ncbi:MAG: APC family permease [Coxiellaceae bacterium]|nr:APC family permease [Coxiellaceae bacterium]